MVVVKQPILVGFILAFGVLVGLALVAPTLQKRSEKPKNVPDFILENVVITQIDHGETAWQLKAHHAEINKQSHVARLTQIQGDFFQKKDLVLSILSPEGTLDLEKNDANLTQVKGVWVAEKNPLQVSVDRLVWNATHEEVNGQGTVVLKNSEMNWTAESFRADFVHKLITVDGKPSTVEVAI